MEDLIKTFHIDWKTLIAQLVNFTVVLVVLLVFAVKPIMKLMKAREDKIARGLQDADVAEQKLQEAEKEKKAAINAGRKEAQQIVNQTEKDAEELKQKKMEQAQTEVKKVIEDARRQIKNEKEQMIRGVKDELGELVMLAVGKISKEGINEKAHQHLIDDAIEEVKASKI
jgi:F-type H+-transporting ATPase subunit b